MPTVNQRLYYALLEVAFAADGTNAYTVAHGVQSCGITTAFNLEYFFELGQLQIYQTVENLPDISVNMEKVMDGYPLLWHLATYPATDPSLFGRSNQKCQVGMSIFSQNSSVASGTPLKEVAMSGLYPNSWAFSVPVQGPVTETLGLIGNNKVWRNDQVLGNSILSGIFSSTMNDVPLNFNVASGQGIQHRWNVVMVPPVGNAFTTDVNGAVTAVCSVFPNDIYGISASGLNPVNADGSYAVPLQSVSISADLGRTPIYELGRKSPFIRYVNPQIEVRTEYEVISQYGDNISATEYGGVNGAPVGLNTNYQTIRVVLQDGTVVDTGTLNKMTNIADSGGEATQGGGNVTTRITYVTYNDLLVTQPNDPSGF
jgi:hypothetical protein